MAAALAAAEAVRLLAAGTGRRRRTLHARKALGGVEVEVLFADVRTQAEKRLYGSHLSGGVGDKPLAADEEDLVAAETVKPRPDVARVQAEPYRTPHGVDHQRRRGIAGPERELLEAGEIGPLRRRLGVVGQRPGDRVADDDQQPDVT